MSDKPLTKTQLRILHVLSDGLPHSRQEIHACLPDELSSMAAIQPHIVEIRKRLRPRGEDVVCEIGNKAISYRHVRLLASNAE